MDIDPVMASIETALAKAEELAERAKDAAGVELASTIADLRESLLDAKRRCLALRDDMAALEELLAAHDQITRERGMLWRFIGKKKIGGPFCPKCYDGTRELIALRYHPGAIGHHPQSPYYACERCGLRFEP